MDQQKEITKDNLEQIIEASTQINARILKLLDDKSLPSDEKSKIVSVLSNNANASQYFISKAKKINQQHVEPVLEDKPLSATNDLDINLEQLDFAPIQMKTKKETDRFHKFKNLIANFRHVYENGIVLQNPAKPDWYQMGYKTSIALDKVKLASTSFLSVIKKFGLFFQQQAERSNVLITSVKNKKNKIDDKIFLIGEKHSVKYLEKKFSNVFSLLNIDSKKIVEESNFVQNSTNEEFKENLTKYMSKSFSAEKIDNNYEFSISKSLPDDLQLEMLTKIIWPKISSALTQNLSFNSELEKTKNNNKYIKYVIDFSTKNNFKPDLVIHSLKHNPSLLEGYPGFSILEKNKDKIIENSLKYELPLKNSFVLLQELITISSKLKEQISTLNIDDKIKEDSISSISSSKVFENIDLTQLLLNVTKLKTQKLI